MGLVSSALWLAGGHRLPRGMSKALLESPALVLYSLAPHVGGSIGETQDFHGYPVLGSISLQGSEKTRIVLNLHAALLSHPLLMAVFCFRPRHGLRALWDGHCYDLLICFECLNTRGFRDNESFEGVIGPFGAGHLNSVLAAHGIPLPPPP